MNISTIVEPDAGLTVESPYEIRSQEPCLRPYVEKFSVTYHANKNFIAHNGVPSCIMLGKHLRACIYMRINNRNNVDKVSVVTVMAN